MGIYISSNASSQTSKITFGGYDTSLMKKSSSIYWFPRDNYWTWSIYLLDAYYAKSSILKKSTKAVFNMGEFDLLIPVNDFFEYVYKIQNSTNNNVQCLLQSKQYQCIFKGFCNRTDITLGNIDLLVTNGITLSIPLSAFLIQFGTVRHDSFTCHIAVRASYDDTYVLGDLFLRHFYTILNDDNWSVGLTPTVDSLGQILDREYQFLQ